MSRQARQGSDLRTFVLGIVAFLLTPVLLPLIPLLALMLIDPPTSSYMLQSPTKPVSHDYVAAKEISPWLARAVIAAEDQNFSKHFGLDLAAIRKAWDENRRGQSRRGASTITQQTIKNLFLWPGGYVRKALEAWLTLWAELLWSKHRILELYLNVAEFGPGIYGAEAAAWHYFGRPAAQLDARQAALMAAVLPNPRKLQLGAPSGYVNERASWILQQMQQMGPLPEHLGWRAATPWPASETAPKADPRR